MKILLTTIFVFSALFVAADNLSAQGKLKLVPIKGSSEVKLVIGKKSIKVNLDDELSGSNGSLAGEPGHKFSVLFIAEKDGYLYLVAKVCSGSPVSNPMAPCGGDQPCAILWIKVNKALTEKEFQSEIYESCSYNYRDSRMTLLGTGLAINFGKVDERKELTYDNSAPEKGLVIK